ncbi:alpha-galactosidase [Enterococcus asini]|uniref:alpha-galactosidase n=1 Tax=Enterococcus asini TaxID=57732 RepID=UPI00288CD378|nr:alpha-galactosidase [Enterococcus asini]MDT2757214.1 alpha-galactosidase [Enterococcus asini]
MIEIVEGRFFHLRNEKISFILHVMKNQQIEQLYYGKTLGKLTGSQLDYLVNRENKSAGTVKFFEDDNAFTLADRPQAYPVYGSSDFKEGAVAISEKSDPQYVDFRLEDYRIEKEKQRKLNVPATYGNKELVETLSLRLHDSERALELTLNYSIFKESAAIVQSQVIQNKSKKTFHLERALSGILNLPTADYEFTHFSGAWLKERQEKRTPLAQGIQSVGSLKGASGHQHNPFVSLIQQQATLDQGIVYGANLIYSGNFLAQVEVDEWDHTRLMLGIHPSQFTWKLNSNESFTTPEAVLMYSDKGTNGLALEYSSFIENHIIDQKWQENPRPIVFNNWEATYFDFTADSLLDLAKTGKDLGMECFVVDDGWFAQRDSDRTSLGDWYPDSRKFPQGLGHFAKEIHNLDLQLGIWFEPEMVSPDSKLYQAHPEWVVGHPFERRSVGRGQYVLDFANPAVVENIYQQMEKIILETKLDYIKWDMNRNITEAYSPYLAEIGRPQSEFFHRYILGVYALYEKILQRFPNVLIEGCAGGGGRYDLGILFYSPQIWPSDDSDGVERLSIQSGTLAGYPLSTFSNHVSANPNHQVLRNAPLKFRQDVAIFGPLGYELDLTQLSSAEKAQIKEQIAFYKAHRQLLAQGQFVQLIDKYPQKNQVCWGVVNEDQSELIVGLYQKLATSNPVANAWLPLNYLDDTMDYRINDQESVPGRVLRNFGLCKPFEFNAANHGTYQVGGDFQSSIFHLKGEAK